MRIPMIFVGVSYINTSECSNHTTEIANNLNMAVSTAYHINSHFEQTGDVIPAALQSKRYDLRTWTSAVSSMLLV